MKIVYIAMPFRAATGWDIELNVRAAEEIALEVWRAGAVALCPHLNTRYFHGVLPDQVWLRGDLHLLRRCDAVLLGPGWVDSAGARTEAAEAIRIGRPVFESLPGLIAWLQRQKPPEWGQRFGGAIVQPDTGKFILRDRLGPVYAETFDRGVADWIAARLNSELGDVSDGNHCFRLCTGTAMAGQSPHGLATEPQGGPVAAEGRAT